MLLLPAGRPACPFWVMPPETESGPDFMPRVRRYFDEPLLYDWQTA